MLAPLTSLALWLAAADRETLNRCPAFERDKHAIQGVTVLIPTLFGLFAAGFTTSTLTSNPWIIGLVALFWSFVILTIDRALLASFRHNLHPTQKGVQFVFRFVLAVVLGMTISHPLVLLLFRDRVDAVLTEERQHEIVKLQERFEGETSRLAERIVGTEASLDQQRAKLTQLAGTKSTAPEDESPAPPEKRSAVGQLDDQLSSLGDQLKQLRTEIAHWESEYDHEITGERSGVAGEGPRAKRIREGQIGWRHEDAKRLGAQIDALTEERRRLAPSLEQGAKLDVQTQAVQIERQLATEDTLATSLQEQIKATLVELEQLRADRLDQTEAAKRQLAALQARAIPSDLLSQTLALHRLFDNEEEGGTLVLVCYTVLAMVFMLLDTIPLITKFTIRPGRYDLLIEELESGTAVDAHRKTGRDLPSLPSLPDLDAMHPVEAARALRDLLDESPNLKTQRLLAEAVGRSQQEISTYFALLRVPQDFQEELLAIPDLPLYSAALVCRRNSPEHRVELLVLLRCGAPQSEIKAKAQILERSSAAPAG